MTGIYGVSYSGTFDGGTIPNNVILGSDVYIVAGAPSAGVQSNLIQKFSIATNTFTSYTFKDTRWGCASVAYGSSIYTISGQSGSVLTDVVVFNTITSAISTVSTGSFTGRLLHTATLYSTSIYIIGGENGGYRSDVSVFNVATSTWSVPTTTGGFTARRLHSATLYTSNNNFLIYVIGGNNGGDLNDVWAFNIYSNVWTSVAYSGTFTARNQHSASLYNGIIYVVGGTCTSNDVQAFKVATASWSTILTSAPKAYSHTGVLYNNFIYTLGGWDTKGAHDFVYMYPLVGGNHKYYYYYYHYYYFEYYYHYYHYYHY